MSREAAMPLRAAAMDAPMLDAAELRGRMIALLEHALTMADELQDATTGYLIERALDEARSQQF